MSFVSSFVESVGNAIAPVVDSVASVVDTAGQAIYDNLGVALAVLATVITGGAAAGSLSAVEGAGAATASYAAEATALDAAAAWAADQAEITLAQSVAGEAAASVVPAAQQFTVTPTADLWGANSTSYLDAYTAPQPFQTIAETLNPATTEPFLNLAPGGLSVGNVLQTAQNVMKGANILNKATGMTARLPIGQALPQGWSVIPGATMTDNAAAAAPGAVAPGAAITGAAASTLPAWLVPVAIVAAVVLYGVSKHG